MTEQNAKQGLAVSDRGHVIELGKTTFTGTGEELLNNREVRQAFLGGGSATVDRFTPLRIRPGSRERSIAGATRTRPAATR